MMNHEEWLERADIYALGALDGEELGEFEAHLASGCPDCESRLRETRESLTFLHRSLTPLPPPPVVKARLLDQIAAETTSLTREGPRPRWFWWSVGAGALAVAGLLITLSFNLWTTRQELQRLEGLVAILTAELSQREETLQLLSDPQARLIHLAALPPSPGATGWLLWNPVAHTGLFIASGLPQPPHDKAYELWAIAGTEPVPAGVFTVAEGGYALLQLPPLPEAKTFDKFAVTLEPAGGVQQPTGPMHLLGSL